MSKPIQEFIGIKRIAAWPQEKDGKPGYAVQYPDGYVSWSPKDEFEKFYMPLTFEPEIGAASSRGEIVNYPTKDAYEKFARAVSAGDDGTCHHLLDFLVHWASIGAPKIDAPEYFYTKPTRGALRIQELLPDNYSESKDWRDGDITERIEWLKGMLESKSNECDMLWDWFNKPDDEARDVLSSVRCRLFESGHVINELAEYVTFLKKDDNEDEVLNKLMADAKTVIRNSEILYSYLGKIVVERAGLYDVLEMAAVRDGAASGTQEHCDLTEDIRSSMRDVHNIREERVKSADSLDGIIDIEDMPYE